MVLIRYIFAHQLSQGLLNEIIILPFRVTALPSLLRSCSVVDLNDKAVATNRKARHEYDILDTWEAGLVLQGSEVKSLRESKVQIAESYVRSEGPELWLIGLHINPYSKTGNLATGHEPDQPRKLLLHRKEINQIIDRIDRDGLTVIPLKLYFSNGRAKIEIALARGRRLHDKRQAIAKRESQRETERSLVRNQKNRNQ